MDNKKFDAHHFDVMIPGSASRIIGICGGCILIVLIIFGVMFLFKFGGVTKGNLYVCLVIEVIFGLMLLQFKTWKLTVRDEVLTVNSIYRKKCIFNFKDIDEVIIGKKNELSIYVKNKKVTTIDMSCTYYDEFLEVLEVKGCHIKKER